MSSLYVLIIICVYAYIAICHQVLDVYSEEEKEQEAKKAKTETQGNLHHY